MTAMRDILLRLADLIADFPYKAFYATTLGFFAFSIILGPFAARIDSNYLPLFSAPPEPEWLDRLSSSLFLDPFWFHFVAALFISVLTFKIARSKDHPFTIAMIASLAPWILLCMTYLLVDIFMKPVFSFPRPDEYIGTNEPPIVRFVYELTGPTFSTPSGFVTRQFVLFYSLLLLSTRADFPIKNRWMKVLMNLFSAICVVIVSFLRIYRNSHTLFDVVVSIGLAAMVFWLINAVPYIFIKHRSSVVNNIATMYMIFVAGFIFYTNNPRYWTIGSFMIVGAVLAINHLAERYHLYPDPSSVNG